MVATAGLEGRIHIDSAGTHDYHAGYPPDRRTQATAAMRGYDMRKLRARRVTRQDFVEFDYILAMDRDNLSHLEQIAPTEHRDKAHLFLDYSTTRRGEEVPDPYYGGQDGFKLVLDMVEDGAAGLLADIKKKLSR